MSAPMFGTVERVERLTPHLVRVIFGGPDWRLRPREGWTDSYVNLLFTPPDAPYAVPFDVAAARSLERDRWPIPRRYTVRHWDPDQRLPRSTSWCTATSERPAPGRSTPSRATWCSSRARAARTALIHPPPGT